MIDAGIVLTEPVVITEGDLDELGEIQIEALAEAIRREVPNAQYCLAQGFLDEPLIIRSGRPRITTLMPTTVARRDG